jgi:hypothetical protein
MRHSTLPLERAEKTVVVRRPVGLARDGARSGPRAVRGGATDRGAGDYEGVHGGASGVAWASQAASVSIAAADRTSPKCGKRRDPTVEPLGSVREHVQRAAAPRRIGYSRRTPSLDAQHRIIFVGGLHRSGTSILARALCLHPSVNGFSNTGAFEDEGQHLQTVVPPDSALGGPGEFAFAREAHLTESSPLVSGETRERLTAEWSPYWDLTKPVLVEKSPPNLVRTRFFAALFPNAVFVNILRHPVAVAYATKKWNKAPLASHFRHWLHAHQILAADLPRLERQIVVRYEEFVRAPQAVVDRVWTLLGVPPGPAVRGVLGDANGTYFARWESSDPIQRARRTFLVRRFEPQMRAFGYSLRDLNFVGPAPALAVAGNDGPQQSRSRTGRCVKVAVGLGRGHGSAGGPVGTEREVRKAAEIASALDQVLPQTLCEMQCGTGEIISFLADRYGAEATGYDTSPEAISLARERQDPRVRFFVGEPPDDVRCDVMLVLDVLDEVENPYALLRALRAHARYFVFHFALDVSAYAVLRGSVGRTRESSDRLYHFTVETALALIERCGYRIRHWRYLPRCADDGGMSVASSLRRVPARLAWHFGRKVVSRALGKATLLVVAEAGGSGAP